MPKVALMAMRPQKPQQAARRLTLLALALFLIGPLGLAACSRQSLPSEDFKILDNSPQARAQALATAKKTCAQQTEHHGISSVMGIFSHLRPGAAQRDYVNCMKAQGFDPDAPDADDATAATQASDSGSTATSGDSADPSHPVKGHIMASPRALTTGINPTIQGY